VAGRDEEGGVLAEVTVGVTVALGVTVAVGVADVGETVGVVVAVEPNTELKVSVARK
jgi:hypothetical protein